MQNRITLQKSTWDIRDAAMVILTIICLILSLNIVLILVNAKAFFEQSLYKSLITTGLFALQEAIFLIPFYFFVIRKYQLKVSELGFSNIGVWQTIKWILKAFGVVIIFNLFMLFIMVQVPEIKGFGPQASHIPLFGGSRFDLILAVLVLVIIAPVIEELIFRGFLLQTFLSRFTPWLASLITAGIFALIHFEFQSIGIIIFLALVLNWIFLRTKSLWPCIGFHMLNNALAFLAEWLVWSGVLQV